MSKYTEKQCTELEDKLDKWLIEIAAEISKMPESTNIEAVVLGGSYGCGEGGIVQGEDGTMHLYNDLDFFVICRNVSRKRIVAVNNAMERIGKDFTCIVGVDVDFSPAKTMKKLRKLPFGMMWQELREGHTVIWGNNDVFQNMPNYDLSRLPLAEGAKLLLNRGVGLLLAENRIKWVRHIEHPDAEDLNFIARNLWKAVLACGDCALITKGAYGGNVSERLKKLVELNDSQSIDFLPLYKKAIAFKHSPEWGNVEELYDLLQYIKKIYKKSYISFMRHTMGSCVNSLEAAQKAFYMRNPFKKDPGENNYLKNIILNLIYCRKALCSFRLINRYPRCRLLLVLPCLLFASDAKNCYIIVVPEMGHKFGELQNLQAFMEFWNRFN
ncbi:MAG: hypothetical protein GY750_19590 [Lentisphaerae bacterium]|nr:hypothetical protein [Lentisphaerota bacterium]MCP4103601.1 hypothetical protein [Lentisphaerota bacterium]